MNPCKHTQFQVFDIFEPRYHDKMVLLMDKRIGEHNKIIFTNAKSMGTLPYYISGQKAKTFKTEQKISKLGNKNKFRIVPEDALAILELEAHCIHEL